MEINLTGTGYAHRLHRLHRFALCLAVITVMVTGSATALPPAADVDRLQLQQIFRDELGRYDRNAISRYLAYTDLGYGHEWCAAFVSYCFGQLGKNTPRTPWSPALFPNSRLVWKYAEKREVPQQLLPGVVWGIHVASKKRIGHVGFVDSYRDGMLITVEGNTSDPEGRRPAGVYRKRRHWRTIHSVSDWLQATPAHRSTVQNHKNNKS